MEELRKGWWEQRERDEDEEDELEEGLVLFDVSKGVFRCMECDKVVGEEEVHLCGDDYRDDESEDDDDEDDEDEGGEDETPVVPAVPVVPFVGLVQRGENERREIALRQTLQAFIHRQQVQEPELRRQEREIQLEQE